MSERSSTEELVIAQAKKKILWWIIGGGLGSAGPFFLALFMVIVAGVFLAGIGNWMGTSFYGPNPPDIATLRSRPAEWLTSATTVAEKDGISNALVIAAMQQASDGQVYGGRYYCNNSKTAGEECSSAFHPVLGVGSYARTLGVAKGLMGLNSGGWHIPAHQPEWNAEGLTHPHSVVENLQVGVGGLAQAVHSGKYLKFTLPGFHTQYQIAPGYSAVSNYAETIKSIVEADQVPALGAWPMARWNSKAGGWYDSQNHPVWVFVVGSAPVGAPFQYTWKPHTTIKSCGKNGCTITIIHHYLMGNDLVMPTAVWASTAKGRVNFTLVTPQTHSTGNIPIWPGGSLFAAKLPINHAFTITAQWPSLHRGLITMSIPFPEQSGSTTGATTFTTPTAMLNQWKTEIGAAASATGVSAPWIASEMSHESGGNPTAGSLGGAYGLMQLEPGTMGATDADRENPATNILYGARLLAANYAIFHSWRMASAAYYGGAGAVENALAAAGISMPTTWVQAAGALNVIPDPQYGNTLTLAQYAENIYATNQQLQPATSSKGGKTT